MILESIPNAELLLKLNFKILNNVVAFVMNCKSLCLSVSKTNTVSTLAPNIHRSTNYGRIMLRSARLAAIFYCDNFLTLKPKKQSYQLSLNSVQ